LTFHTLLYIHKSGGVPLISKWITDPTYCNHENVSLDESNQTVTVVAAVLDLSHNWTFH